MMNRYPLHKLDSLDGWEFDHNRGWVNRSSDRLTVWARWSEEGPDLTVVCREAPFEGRIELWNEEVEFIHRCYSEVQEVWDA